MLAWKMTYFGAVPSICAIIGLSLTHATWAQDKKSAISALLAGSSRRGSLSIGHKI